jgi:thiamine pyrophosphokinase
LGERADHQQINLQLMYRFPQVILEDETQKIQAYPSGSYHFDEGIYTYFSVFTFESALISLSGFTYPLDHFNLTWDSLLTVSNEWNQEKALMQVHQGKVWVVLSKA